MFTPLVGSQADRVEELRKGAMVEYRRKVGAVRGESLVGLSDYRCTTTINTATGSMCSEISVKYTFDPLWKTLLVDHLGGSERNDGSDKNACEPTCGTPVWK